MSTLARGRRPALVGHYGREMSRYQRWTDQDGKPKSVVIIDTVVNRAGTLRGKERSYPAWTRTRNEGTKNPCVTITPPGSGYRLKKLASRPFASRCPTSSVCILFPKGISSKGSCAKRQNERPLAPLGAKGPSYTKRSSAGWQRMKLDSDGRTRGVLGNTRCCLGKTIHAGGYTASLQGFRWGRSARCRLAGWRRQLTC